MKLIKWFKELDFFEAFIYIVFVCMICGGIALCNAVIDSKEHQRERDKIVWELTTEDGEVYLINNMWQENRNDIVSGYDINTGRKVYASGNWRLEQK